MLIFDGVESDGMYALGHVGCALLAYAPVAALLSLFGEQHLAFFGIIVAVSLSTLPDIDQLLPIDHRGPTHTIWFVALVTVLVAVVFAATSDSLLVVFVLSVTALLSLLSHLVADSITPMGITPFAPVATNHYTFDIVPAKHRRANATLFCTGSLAILVTLFVLTG